MKRQLTNIVGSVVLTGSFILGIGATSTMAQGRWNRWEHRQERQGERMERWRERQELERLRQLDRNRQLRYRNNGGNRIVGYYDRFGQFHAYGYYDRFGNFWRYR